MTHKIIETIINRSPHLKWIKHGTILLVRHGSLAYGTNISTSDEDFKGICVPPKEYYFGFSKVFEQAEINEPDAVIFELSKFFRLAAECNPNCIEILFVEPEDIIYASSIGQKLISNRDLFLSKKIKHTMAGYAISQLKRIKSHRRYLLNPPNAPQLGMN